VRPETGEAVASDWFPGQAEAVGQARDFVRGVLADSCPVLDDVLLMVSELASNAVRHTASGDSGGWFDLTVVLTGGGVMISVADRGGSSEPLITGDGAGSCREPLAGGRGLRIVDALAGRWGHSGDELGRVVWFDVTWNNDDPAPDGRAGETGETTVPCGGPALTGR
jgi:serine/threonine-protein kinase RsbW